MTWQNTVFDYLHHTIDSTAMCILAVSGGVDSMALLHLMHHYAPHRIIAATVDHGLRLSSFDEAHQVQQWCAALGVPHVILHWKGKKPNTGIQRQARDARYDALL
ncbi:MAG: tRNA lysidine(34) synthetase TilS, partial [Alphaproteobacteria bacterium]|nr:tRNA lysidine(34) synthetase TilS [Alphaproteobacteria bacterium]